MARTAMYRSSGGAGKLLETEVAVVNVMRGDKVVLHEALEPEAKAWIDLHGKPGDLIVEAE